MLKKITMLLSFIALSNLQAYKIGDTVEPKITEMLKLDNSKVTVVDFFASWCVSCAKELPLVNKLHDDSDPKKVEILGVSTDEDISKGKAFQTKLGLKFRIYDDVKQEVIAAFDPIGMPACYIVKDGKVVDAILGAVDDIDKKLAKKIEGLSQ